MEDNFIKIGAGEMVSKKIRLRGGRILEVIVFVVGMGVVGMGVEKEIKEEEIKEGEIKEELVKKISGRYKTVELGMRRSEVMEALREDMDLEVDTETDYGYFDEEQKYVIKAKRPPLIDSIFYQFSKVKGNGWELYAIIIRFNEQHNSYISVYRELWSRYGEADERTSQYAIWSGAKRGLSKGYGGKELEVDLILNRDAMVKVMDGKRYRELAELRSLRKEYSLREYYEGLNRRLFEGFGVEGSGDEGFGVEGSGDEGFEDEGFGVEGSGNEGFEDEGFEDEGFEEN